MAIDGEFFKRIKDKDTFINEVFSEFCGACEEVNLTFHWNRGKALEAFFLWEKDVALIPLRDEEIEEPCHLKHAAFLIYWLRRCSPVNEFVYEAADFDENIEFMLKYGREFLAFDIGYRAAQVYERGINGRDLPEHAFSLSSFDTSIDSNDFIMTVTQVLKTKNVSPHAIYLVLKAVFLRP